MGISPERIRALKKFLSNPEIGIDNPSEKSLNRYNQALTHGSYTGYDSSYERLEFLGDRVLNLIIAQYLFEKNDEYHEGAMTKMMEFAKNENLQLCVQRIRLFPDDLIQLGKGTELTPNILADAFEAFLGALYLDKKFAATQEFVLKILSQEIENFNPSQNFIGQLQEYCQREKLEMPRYLAIRMEGPPHSPTFTYWVKVNDKTGKGEGRSVTEAEQIAARDALIQLGEMPGNGLKR
jgi:ribonuclease-3